MRNSAIKQFVKTWSNVGVNEIAAAQSHFNDICALVGHDTPLKADPAGNFFRFEQPAEKTGGTRGRADVWYDKKFIWEYKGKHADLEKAYQQLLLYRESLGNPPLLITSDLQRIIIHTNFTSTIKESHEIDLARLATGDGLALLQRVFYDPESFRPTQTQAHVTELTAKNFIKVAEELQKWAKAEGRDEDPERLAHFIIRLLFALFAEDMGLLPENVFSGLVTHHVADVEQFSKALKGLFGAMRDGGMFGYHQIPHFNGGLFDDAFVPDLPGGILNFMKAACDQNWAGIDPSIFGTLFERIIDEEKRAQLGAHYTSREDIMLIVEPVLMQPLREEWQEIKSRVGQTSEVLETSEVLSAFSEKIASTRVLDPACGSGNFLYVALRQLLNLQKEVITFAGRNGLSIIPLTVSPQQLYGIEINPYAHELAQVTVWIGYLQWRFENGFAEIEEPILRPLKNIERKDAILAYDVQGKPVEPEWAEAEVIIGNPPFLGGKRMRSELGDEYVDKIFELYDERVPREADLVCYWFDKSRAMIEREQVKRTGLLATQGIRGGANRRILERISETGNIFWAYSDREWILDGATVHVSMVGFDKGVETLIALDGSTVSNINTDLTSNVDLTIAKRLKENSGIAFMGVTPAGPFTVSDAIAKAWGELPNPNGQLNNEVLRSYYNGQDMVGNPRNVWIIDFGIGTPIEEATSYQAPFEYVMKYVKPARMKQRSTIKEWWLHERARPDMRQAIKNLPRYIATPRVSKHRIFVWIHGKSLVDSAAFVFVRSDDYFFGLLQSRIHELWARETGTQLRDAESGFRYTPRTTFEPFPFPWSPGREPSALAADDCHLEDLAKENAIAEAARQLVRLRQGWLNPPEKDLESIISPSMLKKRTLTNLYNALVYYREKVKGKGRNPRLWKNDFDYVDLELIESLDHIHTSLDHAVLDAYGWSHQLSDEQILENLLALNLERSG